MSEVLGLIKGRVVSGEERPLREWLTEELIDSLQSPLELNVVLESCDALADELEDNRNFRQEISSKLVASGYTTEESEYSISELIQFCRRENLELKIEREMGDSDTYVLKRKMMERSIFEGWTPLGVLFHVMPGNSPLIAVFAAIEGLLTGNVNIIKSSSRNSSGTFEIFQKLGALDSSGVLAKYLLALSISSQDEDSMRTILQLSDGASVWGGDDAVEAIRSLAPPQVRIIPWGHKISLSYVTRESMSDREQLRLLAHECVQGEQQACSSPQVIYADSDSWESLQSFAQSFASLLSEESERVAMPELDVHTQAELTNHSELMKLDAVMGESALIEADDKSWRVLVEMDSSMKTSPLYRTIWIKPLQEKQVVSSLFSWRQYLQTVSLLAPPSRFYSLAQTFLQAGVTRIAPVGKMVDSYVGEPHDGVYALTMFLKRVRLENSDLNGVVNFEDWNPQLAEKCRLPKSLAGESVMSKADFQSQPFDANSAHLYFKSGGSSGEPVVSTFSYRDYQTQMAVAAEGLMAAGLEPESDLVINLFHAGGLYGGFLSFFSILESIQAPHLPMAAHQDLEMVANAITTHSVNVLLGNPSYIYQLLQSNVALFKDYGGIKKIFYGGEHFSDQQKSWLKNELGIEVIKSAIYGSVDAGPLGYQCQESDGAVHHLFDRLHYMEILEIENDTPVEGDRVGRMVFTSKQREGGRVVRYDLGDLGRWIPESCPCGRHSPRFELLGRMGDYFRAGGTFFNYQKFQKVLKEHDCFEGAIQIVLEKREGVDVILLKVEATCKTSSEKLREKLLEYYGDLRESVFDEESIIFEVDKCDVEKFFKSGQSSKNYRVYDRRKR